MANSLGSLVVKLGLDAAEYTNGLLKASDQARRFGTDTARSMDGISRSARSTNDALGLLQKGFALVAASFGLAELKRLSDEYQNAAGRLSIFSTSQADLTRTLQLLFGVAQNTRQSLAATVDLYYQLANATQEAGLTQKELLDITTGVNKGLIISGSTGDSAKGVIIQLSQALAAGKLRGQEFNTVNEQGNRILRALGEGLGKTTGQLREMANNGEITTDIFVQGLQKGLAGIDKDFEKIPVTITGGFTKLTNALQQYIGTTLQAQGQSNLIAKGLDLLATNFDYVVAAASGFIALKIGNVVLSTASAFIQSTAAIVGETAATRAATAAKADELRAKLADLAATEATIVAARAQTIAELQKVQAIGAVTAATQARSAALIADLAMLGRAQAAVTASTVATNAALTGVATGGASIAARALGFLGGPIGAITLLLGLGVTAWQIYASTTEQSANKAKNATENSTEDILVALQRQIDKIKERNNAANQGPTVKTSLNPGATAEVLRLENKLRQLRSSGSRVDQVEAIDVQARLDQFYTGLDELNRQSEIEAKRMRKEKLGQWMLDYANDAEKAGAEIQKAKNELGELFTPELEKRIREKFSKKPPVDDPARKIMEGQVKALEADIAREKDLLTGYEGFLRDTYAMGLQSVNGYYDKLQNARDENLRRQLQAYDDEITATEIYLARAKKDTDRQDALNRIDEVRAKKTNLLRDAGIQEQALNRDRIRANQEYIDSLDEINAKLLEMSGNTAEAARIRFDAANRIQRAMLTTTDDSASRLALERLNTQERQLIIQSELNDKYKQYGLVLGDLELEQQRIQIQVSGAQMTELNGLYALSDLNAKRIGQLREIVAQYEAIAARSMDPADLQKAQQMRVALEQLATQTDLVAKKFNELFANELASALVDVVMGAKSVKQAFNDMAKSIVKNISDIAAKNLAQALFGQGGAGAGMGDFFSKIFGSSGFSGGPWNWLMSLFGGGPFGGSGPMLGSGYSFFSGGGGLGFAAAGTDYARGGWTMVGESGPEIVNLPRGSQVLNNSDTRSALSNNMSITIAPPAGMSRQSAQQYAVMVGAEISRRMKRA